MRGGNLARMAPRSLRFVALSALLAALASCRRAAENTEPASCNKMGQTCKLGPGVLGVCTTAPPDKCDHEPCLVCMAQH